LHENAVAAIFAVKIAADALQLVFKNTVELLIFSPLHVNVIHKNMHMRK